MWVKDQDLMRCASNLAKVGVVSSNLIARSNFLGLQSGRFGGPTGPPFSVGQASLGGLARESDREADRGLDLSLEVKIKDLWYQKAIIYALAIPGAGSFLRTRRGGGPVLLGCRRSRIGRRGARLRADSDCGGWARRCGSTVGRVARWNRTAGSTCRPGPKAERPRRPGPRSPPPRPTPRASWRRCP